MKRLIRVLLAIALSLTALPALAQSGTITLYTSQPETDANKTVAGFRSVHPNVRVNIFRSGTTQIMSKLEAEIAAGRAAADVLLIADATSMQVLKAQNMLLAYPQARVAGLAPGSYDPDFTFFGSKLITTGIAYNTDGGVAPPTSWADLKKPEYKDRISMPSPLYSGAAAIFLSGLVERADLGWTFFEALRDNNAAPLQGNGAVLTAVAGGERPIGILVDFMAFNAKRKGAPIGFVFPNEGVPAVTEPVAILRTTKNPDAARAFIDFILSPEGQKLAVSMGYIPVRADVGDPSWLPSGTKINLMPLDSAQILRNTAADKKRFSDLFGG